MTLAEAQDMVARCGMPKAPPVAGLLVHAWDGWATHGVDDPKIIFTHDQVKEARRIIAGKVTQLTEEISWRSPAD